MLLEIHSTAVLLYAFSHDQRCLYMQLYTSVGSLNIIYNRVKDERLRENSLGVNVLLEGTNRKHNAKTQRQ